MVCPTIHNTRHTTFNHGRRPSCVDDDRRRQDVWSEVSVLKTPVGRWSRPPWTTKRRASFLPVSCLAPRKSPFHALQRLVPRRNILSNKKIHVEIKKQWHLGCFCRPSSVTTGFSRGPATRFHTASVQATWPRTEAKKNGTTAAAINGHICS